MEKTKKEQSKLNIIYISLLILTIIAVFFILGSNIYSPYSDIGREFYLTERVLDGDVLYKDIFNVYSPWGYWLNAIIIKIFGSNINIFGVIGLITSILTIIPLFLITKAYTNRNVAFTTSLFLIFSCIYYPSISNRITPYSYSIIYALCATVWSFFFLHKYLTSENKKFLYISALLAGLSICFKYEYIGFIAIISGISIYKEEYIKPLIYMAIMPIISLIVLLFQHCTFGDLFIALNYMISVSKSHSANYFYQYAGIAPTIDNIKNSFLNLLNPQFRSIFAPICIINIILLLFSIKKKDLLLSILILTGILTSIKTLGGLSFEIYGTYFFPLLFISLIAFIYRNITVAKPIIISVICLILSSFYFIYTINESNKLVPVSTSKGNFKIPQVFYNSTIDILEYISNNTKRNDNVLILPEGTLINFLTNRKSDPYLYYLIPPNAEIFSKEFILNQINETDYVITTNIQYPWYGEKSFMTGYGREFMNLLNKEFELIAIVGKNLKFYVYKHDIIKQKDWNTNE